MLDRLNIKPENIVQLEAVSNYTRIRLTNGRSVMSSYNLGKLCASLPPTFVRNTRSTVVNLQNASPFYFSRRRKPKAP